MQQAQQLVAEKIKLPAGYSISWSGQYEFMVHAAIIDGVLLRARPIMMTVAAIIAGLLPIMFGGGTGSEVMRRIAASMVGGMVSATVLTLVVLSEAFLLWKSRGLER